jgi:hypothetical protein
MAFASEPSYNYRYLSFSNTPFGVVPRPLQIEIDFQPQPILVDDILMGHPLPPSSSLQNFNWENLSVNELLQAAQHIAAVLKEKGVVDLPNQFKLYL